MKTTISNSIKKVEVATVAVMMSMMGASANAQVNKEALMDKGGLQGGGGDTKTEGRIDEIRNDILQWIQQGGAQSLKFDNGLSYQVYVPAMNQVLAKQAVVVSAINTAQENAADSEMNTSVAGQPKTCKGFISQRDGLPHVLCNVERFADTSEADQYRLVHHEYAGLALTEKNVGAASDYSISNQITSSLEKTTVLRLVVKSETSASDLSLRNLFIAGKPMSLGELINRQHPLDALLSAAVYSCTDKNGTQWEFYHDGRKEFNKSQSWNFKGYFNPFTSLLYNIDNSRELGYNVMAANSAYNMMFFRKLDDKRIVIEDVYTPTKMTNKKFSNPDLSVTLDKQKLVARFSVCNPVD